MKRQRFLFASRTANRRKGSERMWPARGLCIATKILWKHDSEGKRDWILVFRGCTPTWIFQPGLMKIDSRGDSRRRRGRKVKLQFPLWWELARARLLRLRLLAFWKSNPPLLRGSPPVKEKLGTSKGDEKGARIQLKRLFGLYDLAQMGFISIRCEANSVSFLTAKKCFICLAKKQNHKGERRGSKQSFRLYKIAKWAS